MMALGQLAEHLLIWGHLSKIREGCFVISREANECDLSLRISKDLDVDFWANRK